METVGLAHRGFGYSIVANRPIASLTVATTSETAAPAGPAGPAAPEPRPVSREIGVTLQGMPGALRWPDAGASQPFYVSPFVAPDGAPMLQAWRREAGEFHELRYWDGSVCVIHQSGASIWLRWPDQVRDPEDFLLGPGLGLALRLQGELCLHAAAASIDGRAVLLAGPSRAGKSTLAAVLGAAGHGVITEDLAVVASSPGGFVIHPGRRCVRLRHDAVPVVERAAGRRMVWSPSPDDAFMDLVLGQGGLEQPAGAVEIDAVYFLDPTGDRSSGAQVKSMPRAEALMQLVSDSFAVRLVGAAEWRSEFESACDLVNAVRLRRIRFPAGEDTARSTCDVIVQDALAARSLT